MRVEKDSLVGGLHHAAGVVAGPRAGRNKIVPESCSSFSAQAFTVNTRIAHPASILCAELARFKRQLRLRMLAQLARAGGPSSCWGWVRVEKNSLAGGLRPAAGIAVIPTVDFLEFVLESCSSFPAQALAVDVRPSRAAAMNAAEVSRAKSGKSLLPLIKHVLQHYGVQAVLGNDVSAVLEALAVARLEHVLGSNLHRFLMVLFHGMPEAAQQFSVFLGVCRQLQ
mmetsp:Transcript_28957/g.72742  ORF Transcript_28957/g.72742 Transcript_28957/m.72742 type:complete len:225 (-) Transcript_28957:713-1387(-)